MLTGDNAAIEHMVQPEWLSENIGATRDFRELRTHTTWESEMWNDDPVLALGAELRGIAAERTRLAAEHLKCQLAGGCLQEVDDDFAVLCKKFHPTMRRLADTPAETADGILLKLRTVAANLASGQTSPYDEDILLLAIADLERLAW